RHQRPVRRTPGRHSATGHQRRRTDTQALTLQAARKFTGASLTTGKLFPRLLDRWGLQLVAAFAFEYVEPIRLGDDINIAAAVHGHPFGLVDALHQAVETAEQADETARSTQQVQLDQ